MRTKLLGTGVVLSAALLALAGCNSGGPGGYGGSSPTATTTTTTTTTATTSATASTSPSASASASGSSSPSAGATAAAPVTRLKAADSSLGKIIVTDTGMTVYQFTKDTKDSGTSACTGGCLAAWPPVLTTSDAPALDGVTAKVGTITTPDNKKQVTVNGLPIYYWAQDAKPGDVTGQGVQGVWYVVSPSGDMVKDMAK